MIILAITGIKKGLAGERHRFKLTSIKTAFQFKRLNRTDIYLG